MARLWGRSFGLAAIVILLCGRAASQTECPTSGANPTLSNCVFSSVGTYTYTGTATMSGRVTLSMNANCAYTTLKFASLNIASGALLAVRPNPTTPYGSAGSGAAGGSNGGRGGISINQDVGPSSSSPTWVTSTTSTLACGGSGGGNALGGGVVDILASGTVTISGNITANGQDAQSISGGGGEVMCTP